MDTGEAVSIFFVLSTKTVVQRFMPGKSRKEDKTDFDSKNLHAEQEKIY
jgi:hypothetical protein